MIKDSGLVSKMCNGILLEYPQKVEGQLGLIKECVALIKERSLVSGIVDNVVIIPSKISEEGLDFKVVYHDEGLNTTRIYTGLINGEHKTLESVKKHLDGYLDFNPEIVDRYKRAS